MIAVKCWRITMAKQKRDSAYYLGRIERDFPHVFADYQAGKFGSVTEATIAAGIKKPRTRLQELQNAWRRATSAEQRALHRGCSGACNPIGTATDAEQERLKEPA